MVADNKGSKHYIEWIDVAKGIGILLVIVGHCIFPLHVLIDVFHMPLFFFIAGITFSHKSDTEFLVSKVNRIGIPYCFWMVVSALLSMIPHPYTGPFNGPLWFLQSIFISLIIMHVLLGGGQKTGFILFLFLFIVSWILVNGNINVLPFDLSRSIVGFLYIYIGFIFRDKFKPQYSVNQLISLLIISLTIFSVLFCYLYKFRHITGAFFNLSIYSDDYFFVVICSLAGIASTIFLSKFIKHSRWLCWMGRNSLVIMCVHFPVAQCLNVYIASSGFYDSLTLRSFAAVSEYIIVTCFSCICAILCKRFIPQLTGYKSLIKD